MQRYFAFVYNWTRVPQNHTGCLCTSKLPAVNPYLYAWSRSINTMYSSFCISRCFSITFLAANVASVVPLRTAPLLWLSPPSVFCQLLFTKSSWYSLYEISSWCLYNSHNPGCAVAQLVECRTRNRESPGSNPRCYRFEVWAFSFTSRRLSRLSCINEYLAIDSGGNVSE